MQKLLEEQLLLEQEAATMYNSLLLHFKNPDIQRDLSFIRDQEIEHARIVKEALELLG